MIEKTLKQDREFMGRILPLDAQEYLKNISLCQINPYLSHNRFLERVNIGNRDKMQIQNQSILMGKLKDDNMKAECFCKENICDNRSTDKECNHGLKELMLKLNKRNERIAGQFARQESFVFEPYDKLIMGMGGNSPYSNIQLFRMHFLYGIPYIPASGIKGALRSCWLLEEEPDESFYLLFGSEEEDTRESKRGELVFFDTYPSEFSLGLDVQVPHYFNYYKGTGSPPLDNENTQILYFTCLYDSSFSISIACRDEALWDREKARIENVMEIMLTQYGLGAKTALGYGIMDKG